jgi:hypothetical protein
MVAPYRNPQYLERGKTISATRLAFENAPPVRRTTRYLVGDHLETFRTPAREVFIGELKYFVVT